MLAGPLLGGEGIRTAELDVDDILKAKFDLDVVGHYARSDSKLPHFKTSDGLDLTLVLTVFQLKASVA